MAGRSAYAGAMIEADKIGSVLPGRFPALDIRQLTGTSEIGEKSFSELLADGIDRVQSFGEESDTLSLDMALGRPVELHQAMIAATKAQIALELLIQVRNKLIEAYQEISRMQV